MARPSGVSSGSCSPTASGYAGRRRNRSLERSCDKKDFRYVKPLHDPDDCTNSIVIFTSCARSRCFADSVSRARSRCCAGGSKPGEAHRRLVQGGACTAERSKASPGSSPRPVWYLGTSRRVAGRSPIPWCEGVSIRREAYFAVHLFGGESVKSKQTGIRNFGSSHSAHNLAR